MLDVRDVTVRFGDRTVLDRVSLRRRRPARCVAAARPVRRRQEHAAARRSPGCSRPTPASVWLDGVDITHLPPHRRRIGLMFQDEQLFPHLDVAANVGFGLRMQRRRSRERDAHGSPSCSRSSASPASSAVGSTTLSGGEAKRVALARSLAPAPAVLLLDEPLTGLDRELHDRLAADLAARAARHRHHRACSSPTTATRPPPSPTGPCARRRAGLAS